MNKYTKQFKKKYSKNIIPPPEVVIGKILGKMGKSWRNHRSKVKSGNKPSIKDRILREMMK